MCIRIAKIKNTDNTKCWQRCRETRTLMHWSWGCKLFQAHWNSLDISYKVYHTLPYDPAISLESIHASDIKMYVYIKIPYKNI